jgi:hypothetical protein
VCWKPCSSCWSFHLLREEFLWAPIHSPLSGSPYRSFNDPMLNGSPWSYLRRSAAALMPLRSMSTSTGLTPLRCPTAQAVVTIQVAAGIHVECYYLPKVDATPSYRRDLGHAINVSSAPVAVINNDRLLCIKALKATKYLGGRPSYKTQTC